MGSLRRALGLLTLGVLLAACASDSTTPAPLNSETTTARPAATADPSASATAAPAATASASAGSSFDPAAVAIDFEVAVSGLEAPLAIAHAGDGSGRLFVVEQEGRVRIVRDGELVREPFLDIADRVLAGGEQGLLGLAFHPSFPDDPRLFLNYTDRSGTTTVSSFTVGDDPDRTDPGTEIEILRIAQPYANHNGGALAFGPDGFLYIATGDGGAGGDPHDNGQRLDTLLGKILRIDVDATAGDRAYGIPDDNPFVDDPDAEPEIFLTGLRNPWRISFDRATGDLWIGDVGQGRWEEVNVARAGEAGLNFGWRRMEGRECFEGAGCDDSAFALPVSVYNHDLGCSITGGAVYRGTAVPGLVGGYLYADYCSGNVWVLDPSRERDTASNGRLVLESGRSISAIGEDQAGELFATDLAAGDLLRVVPAGT